MSSIETAGCVAAVRVCRGIGSNRVRCLISSLGLNADGVQAARMRVTAGVGELACQLAEVGRKAMGGGQHPTVTDGGATTGKTMSAVKSAAATVISK